MKKIPLAKPDVLSLLKQDHVELKQLLEQLTRSGEQAQRRRRELVASVRSAIEMHSSIEEEIFYPALRSAARSRADLALYYEALEEHHAAATVLEDLAAADPAAPSFSGKAKVLKELVLHHAREEEKAMFPRARKLLTRDIRKALGEQVELRKLEFRATG